MSEGLICKGESKVFNFKNQSDVLGRIKLCGKEKDLCKARKLHSKIQEEVLIWKNVYISTALVSMYAKSGALQEAQRVFDELLMRNGVAWNALINAYSQHGFPDEAIECFLRMREEGFLPDKVTFICILKASSSSIKYLRIGQNLHVEISRQGLLEKDVVLGTTLMNMYARFGFLEKAQEVFELLPFHDVASWSALIAGYARHGFGEKALKCYRKMQCEGISPNSVTFIFILKTCGGMGCLQIGEEIHLEAKRAGLIENNIVLGTMLVDMYAKCGAMEKAREVFEELQVRDVVSWSALISGYAQHSLGDEALKCFQIMKDQGIPPNAITFSSILKVCGNIGSLEIGEGIYAEVREQGLLRKDMVLGNSLVDMFVKCGRIGNARDVFEQLPERDVVSWSSLLAGYAQMGNSKRVLKVFNRMKSEGIIPNLVTFLALMSSCNHNGLVNEGMMVFDDMSSFYCLAPSIEHYTCMIDLFARAGHFDKAIDMLESISFFDRLPLLLALLGACCIWVNVDIGRRAFEELMHLDSKCSTAYVSMRNIYATANMQEEGGCIEA